MNILVVQLIQEVILSSPVRSKSPKANPYSIAYVVEGFPNVVVKGALVVAMLVAGKELLLVSDNVVEVVENVETWLDE